MDESGLTTERMVLRPLRQTDLRALHALYADPDLMRYVTGRPRTPWESRARLRKDLRHHREHGFGLCLGLERDSGEVVGRFGIEPRVTARGLEGELAWMVASPHQGRGLATEAARALIEYARRELPLVRLWASCDPDNAPSIRIMEKAGLVPTGRTETELLFEHPTP